MSWKMKKEFSVGELATVAVLFAALCGTGVQGATWVIGQNNTDKTQNAQIKTQKELQAQQAETLDRVTRVQEGMEKTREVESRFIECERRGIKAVDCR